MSDQVKPKGIFEKPVTRRNFLKISGAAAATGMMSTGLSACSPEIYRGHYPDVPQNHVSLSPNGKSVLILGGGFGGMHAACELLDRGFEVTIIEKSSMLGGKLKSWRDPGFGIPPTDDPNWKGYPRDHGAHAVWGFYNNLREFMGRHGYKLWTFPRESSMYNFLDKDGSQAVMGSPPTWPGPLAHLQRGLEAKKALEALTGEDLGSMPYMKKVMGFDYDSKKQRAYLDGMSFPEWARLVGIPDKVIYKFFGPTSEMAMFDHIDNTSALYLLTTMDLGSGSYKDMCIDIFMHPPGETYVKPIERYILAKGGKIIYDMPVIKVNHDGKAIKSVLAGDEAYVPGVKNWKCGVCGSTFPSPAKPFRCPVCGAPSAQIRPLSSGPPKEYLADYYVVAMDTPGAKQVVAKSGLLGDPYFDNIMKLDATGVYVVNLWYSDCNAWERRFPEHADFFASGFKFLGITLNWASADTFKGHQGQGPLVPDYHGKNINVIETQIANTERVENMPDEEIARLVHEELLFAIPDLPAPTDFYVNRWDTYSPQRPGYEALRPEIQSPVDNLFFIGDWVLTNHKSVYMEKTNVASKMVTNLLLDKIGQKQGRIKILKSGDPGLTVKILKAFNNPYA